MVRNSDILDEGSVELGDLVEAIQRSMIVEQEVRGQSGLVISLDEMDAVDRMDRALFFLNDLARGTTLALVGTFCTLSGCSVSSGGPSVGVVRVGRFSSSILVCSSLGLKFSVSVVTTPSLVNLLVGIAAKKSQS